jgi:hypothetical protein
VAEPQKAPDASEDRRPAAVAAGSLARRFGRRFLLLYVSLYSLELVVGLLGAPNGSGDRTFDYVAALGLLILALGAAFAWIFLERSSAPEGREEQERRLDLGLRLAVRHALALALLALGMSKIFGLQFQFPDLGRLEERIGDSSPLALYSVFMGYSRRYTLFVGTSEAMAGFLLLFRRTTTLGALVALGVLGDLAMLAFTYDLPRKLLSIHLLLMAGLLLAPDLRRLVDALVLDRPTRPADREPPLSGRLSRIALPGLVALFVGLALLSAARQERVAPRKIDPSKYLLVTRGVHIIDDDPINR